MRKFRLTLRERRLRAAAREVWTDEKHLRWTQSEMHELLIEIDRVLDGDGDLYKMLGEGVDLTLILQQFMYNLREQMGAAAFDKAYASIYEYKLRRTERRVEAKQHARITGESK